MTYFGWSLRNGALAFGGPITAGGSVSVPIGSTSAPGLIVGGGKSGISAAANGQSLQMVANGIVEEFITAGEVRHASDVDLSWSSSTSAVGAASDTFFRRIGANRLSVYDGSTTAGTIRLGIPEFSQAASTFAQTATITNGPRAANPVHWLEVTFNNGASSGRIPIW
jgi:hypothetical protein